MADLDVSANVSLNLQDATSVLDDVLSQLSPVLEDVTGLTESVVSDTVAPLLDNVVGSVSGLDETLSGLLGSLPLKKRGVVNKRAAEEDITALFQGVADVVGSVQKVAGDVPAVGPVLDDVLKQLNPVLSEVLNSLNELVGPLAEDLLKTVSPSRHP